MWRGADGDGVYDGPCWPHAGYDNCPDVYNPDQTDYVDNYRSEYHVGYACRTYDCGNGIQEPSEACDDGNNVSGDRLPQRLSLDGVLRQRQDRRLRAAR